jgi:hypothetical protein
MRYRDGRATATLVDVVSIASSRVQFSVEVALYVDSLKPSSSKIRPQPCPCRQVRDSVFT